MKVKIEGLDCPNCSKVLETRINKIDGVSNAKIDFLKGELTFSSKNQEKSLTEIKKLSKALFPNVLITEDENKKMKNTLVFDVAILLIGVIVGALSIFIQMPKALFWVLFPLSALIMGYKTFYKAVKLLLKGTVNENLLVTISVIGAAAVGEHLESLMVIALYSIGKILEQIAVNKSKKSIKELTNFKPEYAIVIKDGKEKKVSPEEVEIDDVIIVRPGERVSIDGVVVEGKASLDLQSLTGESLPFNVEENQEILSGSIVLNGVLKIKATKKYEEGTVNTILNLIETASEKKSKTETFISKITKWYTLGVMVLSLVTFAVVLLVTKNVNVAVYRGLIFLVVSCPCAFAISVPLSYFSGLGNASKKGILIKGSNYLDACAKLSSVAFDKTGTITTGDFEVVEVKSLDEKLNKEDIIFLSSVGEQYSLHPLAKSIVKANTKTLVEAENVKEVVGEGVYYTFNDKNYFVGKKEKDSEVNVSLYENDVKIGEIYLKDKIKENAKITAEKLAKLKVKTVMLSGDREDVAQSVAQSVGISETHAKLLPQDKFDYIKNSIEKGERIGFVGDGLNDAPSLTLADVGFCMGLKGNAASIEASDVVIANDNLEKIPQAIKISKHTRKIVWQNIILSLIIKVTFLLTGAIGLTGMLEAVIADVGVTVMAILNSLRALNYKEKDEKTLNKR